MPIILVIMFLFTIGGASYGIFTGIRWNRRLATERDAALLEAKAARDELMRTFGAIQASISIVSSVEAQDELRNIAATIRTNNLPTTH